jgi:tripartite-type tricarboxylate transporter receptor subunit TctC
MLKLTHYVAALLTILATTSPSIALAQQDAYPNRPINMIVPFAPGNINDVHARLVAKAISTDLGQQVIVENKAGAAGIIGTQFASNAKPDGYTILWGSSGPLATHPFVYKRLPYSQQSLSPVNGVGAAPLMMVASSTKPYKNLSEFIEYAKKNPGKATFGSSGIGTGGHLAGELFQMTTGVQMLHIPYKDASSLSGDLFGGRVDVVFDFIPVIASHIKSGKLIGLGITSENRNKNFSEVPTFKERGYNITITSWNAIMVPAQTSPAIIKRLSDAAKVASKAPEVLRFEQDFDTISIFHMGPEALRQFIASESDVFRSIVAKTGLTIEN